MGFQGVQTPAPEFEVRPQPGFDGCELARLDAVEAALAVGADADQACLAQKPQMLGNPRLADRQRLDHVPGRPLAGPQQIEDAPTWTESPGSWRSYAI